MNENIHLKAIFEFSFKTIENLYNHGRIVTMNLEKIIFNLDNVKLIESLCEYVGNKHKNTAMRVSNFKVVLFKLN